MKSIKLTMALFVGVIIFISSCKKQDNYLDVKRNKSDVVPETLADFQAVLDNTVNLSSGPTPGLVGADNFYLSDANFNSATETERNLYLWKKQIWPAVNSIEWTNGYRDIELANVVFDGIEKVNNNSEDYRNILGQAYFWRAFKLYNLAQIFCKPYNSITASTDLGLPLRNTSDVNVIFPRASLQDTYNAIISDINSAVSLLPNDPKFTTRPSRPAALGLLSRIYLVLGNFAEAYKAADLCIKLKPSLLDFNSNLVSLTSTYRFSQYGIGNPEVLFYVEGGGYTTILANATAALGFINPALYNSYNANDLRKALFYNNTGNTSQVKFRGCYSGGSSTFNGIGTNEIYFIRAESLVRLGKITEGVADLNAVLLKRFKTGTFVPFIINDEELALKTILDERRKELPFTGNLRWEDLRRLNSDPRFAVTQSRLIAGQTYLLSPNDVKYTLPLPDNEIQLTGLEQNER